MGSYISKGMSGAMEKMQEQQQTMVHTVNIFSIILCRFSFSLTLVYFGLRTSLKML